MASIDDLAPRAVLSGPELAHLHRLTRSWNLLADLSFADVLLYGRSRDHPGSFVTLGQIRPSTAPTLYREDRVGRIVDGSTRPLLSGAFATGEPVDGGLLFRPEAARIRVLNVPVRVNGAVPAVLSRQFSPDAQRLPGDLERAYFTLCRRLDRMVTTGLFPFEVDEEVSGVAPRVGDGVMAIDAGRHIEFVSPNVVSALLRLGLPRNPEGMRLDDLGLETGFIERSFQKRRANTVEIERSGDVSIVMHCVPLIEDDAVTGGLVLVRDISEVRRRDRLLLSKDAAIAEIHHRVKNNLQTVSSLLHLQGRRVANPEGRKAIEESVRRVRSIAVVHEILSHETRDDVPFVELLRALVRMVEESLVDPERRLAFRIEGDVGTLPSEVTTQLAVVITELLQNAVDHAYPAPGGGGVVNIGLAVADGRLVVTVIDDGVGLGDRDDVKSGLGLTIVNTMVTSELGGSFVITDRSGPLDAGEAGGTEVRIDVPLPT